MLDISVIIPTMGTDDLIKEVLLDIKEQHLSSFEVIIINNGNKKNVSQITSKFSFAKEIIFNKNKGFAVAVNKGIQEAKSKYILILNDDMQIRDKNILSSLITIMDQKKYDGIAIKILNKEKCIESCGDCYGPDNRPFGCKKNFEREILGPTGGFALYKKEIFEEGFMYDEDFFAYFEDIDLNIRFQYKNKKIFYIPDFSVKHLGSVTASKGGQYKGYSEKKVFWMARNRFFIIIKNWPLSLIVKKMPCWVGGFFLSFLFHIKTGYWYAYCSGLFEGLNNAYKMKKKRNLPENANSIMEKIWNMR